MSLSEQADKAPTSASFAQLRVGDASMRACHSRGEEPIQVAQHRSRGTPDEMMAALHGR